MGLDGDMGSIDCPSLFIHRLVINRVDCETRQNTFSLALFIIRDDCSTS